MFGITWNAWQNYCLAISLLTHCFTLLFIHSTSNIQLCYFSSILNLVRVDRRQTPHTAPTFFSYSKFSSNFLYGSQLQSLLNFFLRPRSRGRNYKEFAFPFQPLWSFANGKFLNWVTFLPRQRLRCYLVTSCINDRFDRFVLPKWAFHELNSQRL